MSDTLVDPPSAAPKSTELPQHASAPAHTVEAFSTATASITSDVNGSTETSLADPTAPLTEFPKLSGSTHLDAEESDYDLCPTPPRLASRPPSPPLIEPEPAPSPVGSVMPSTMAAAHKFVDNTRSAVADVSEAVGILATGAVAAAALKQPSDDQVATASHAGGAVGRQLGELTSRTLEALLPLLARNAGAHQCDACGAKNLYNYYKNTATSEDIDLCLACYPRWLKKDSKAYTPKTKNLSFTLHDNTMFTLKLLGIAVLAGAILKKLLVLVFFR